MKKTIALFTMLALSVGLFSFALGASAAVLALIAAMGTAQPDYPVRLFLFGQIRMKYIAIGLILISFLSVPSANAGGEIAHLGELR